MMLTKVCEGIVIIYGSGITIYGSEWLLCVGFLAMPLTCTVWFCPITGCGLDVSNLQNGYDYHGTEFCVSESKRQKKRLKVIRYRPTSAARCPMRCQI